MVIIFVVRQKVDLQPSFYFGARIPPEVRDFIEPVLIYICLPIRYGTIGLRWKTTLRLENTNKDKSL